VAEDFPQVIARFPRVSVDTNVCIYFLGQVRPWFDACATVFEHAAARRTRIELCGIVQLELLVGTFARPDSNERRRIVDLTERTNGIVTTPISRDALFAAAQTDAEVRRRIHAVMNMLAPLSAFFSPEVLGRVAIGSLRRWAAVAELTAPPLPPPVPDTVAAG